MNFELSLGSVCSLDLFQVMEATTTVFPWEHRALVDNGSQATTTNKRFLLHQYHPVKNSRVLHDAGGKVTYNIEGQGILMVPRGDGSFLPMKCWYTPTLPVTVISPGEHVQQCQGVLASHTVFSHEFKGSGEVRFQDVNDDTVDVFQTQYFRKKSVTLGLLPSHKPVPSTSSIINALSEEGNRVL